MAAPIYIPTNSVGGFPFLHILTNICYLCSFWWKLFWHEWGNTSLWVWFAQKTKIMASGPITSWQIGGEKVEVAIDFIFLGSKITVEGNCHHEIKRNLLLGRIAMTNLHSILKSRDNTLPTKVRLVKAMVFPVVTYGCELDYKESWVPKNWCFQIVVLEETLKNSLDCKEIKTSQP